MPTKVYGSASSVTIMGEYVNPLPSVVAESMLNDKDIITTLSDNYGGGLINKSNRLFSYGRTKYERGLPHLLGVDLIIPYAAIKATIELERDTKIDLVSVIYSKNSDEHAVKIYLQNEREYDETTDRIYNFPPGVPVDATECLYLNYTFIIGNDYTTINYKYLLDGVYINISENLIIESKYQDMFLANFFVKNSLGVNEGFMQSWSYVVGAGNPALDLLTIRTIDNPAYAEYYPIIPFYEDKKQIGASENADSNLYAQCKRMVEIIGTSYKELVHDLHEGTEESIGKNKGLFCYLGFFIDVTAGITKNADATDEDKANFAKANKGSILYLIEYFKKLYESKLSNPQHISNAFTITDERYECNFEYARLNWTTEFTPGVIGTCGGDCELDITIVSEAFASLLGSKYEKDISRLTYWHQISDTHREVVTVIGLVQKIEAHSRATVTITLQDSFKEEPTLLRLPMSKLVLNSSVPNYLKESVLQTHLAFTFAAYQRVEIKWYETKAFKIIVTIIAVVLAIPSGGSSLKLAGALLATGNYLLLTYLIIGYYLSYLLLKKISEIIINAIGLEAAYFLAIFSMIAGNFSNGYLQKLFLDLRTGLLGGLDKELKDSFEKLQKEYATYATEAEKLNKELEDAQKAFDNTSTLNFDVLGSAPRNFRFGILPNEYIEDALRLNTNAFTLEIPSIYSDLLLRLPTIDTTLTNKPR